MHYTGDSIVNKITSILRSLLMAAAFLASGCDRTANAPATPAAQPGNETASEMPTAATPAQPMELGVEELQKIFTVLNPVQKAEFIKNPDAFAGFVNQESQALSLSAAARANKIHEDPNVIYIMGRMSENVLREAYLERLMLEKIPADFPRKEQVQEFYEQNRDQFMVEDRIHVWQIFLKVANAADKEEVARQKDLATKILGDIRAGKTRALENGSPVAGHLVQETVHASPLQTIETAVGAAHKVKGQRSRQKTKGRSHTGTER